MNRVDLFNNIVIMAAVDGTISDEEAAFLAQRALRWGITEDEAQQAIQNAMSNNREFSIPASKAERLDVLREMVRMMAVDGNLAPVEKQLCSSAAVAMDISTREFKDLVASMT